MLVLIILVARLYAFPNTQHFLSSLLIMSTLKLFSLTPSPIISIFSIIPTNAHSLVSLSFLLFYLSDPNFYLVPFCIDAYTHKHTRKKTHRCKIGMLSYLLTLAQKITSAVFYRCFWPHRL